MRSLGGAPEELRRTGIVAITLGAMAIAISIYAYRWSRDTQAGDIRDVTALVIELDSVRGALRATRDSGEIARLRASVEFREHHLSRRAFHIPMRAESLRTWWRPTGRGTLAVAAGLLLIALGLTALRSARRGG
jgi:hypothetical protein